jgi:hypothetical protein
MPTWISDRGTWHPAKEHVVLPHLQGTSKEVYDGPDRAALYQLWEESGKPEDAKKCMEVLGSDFRMDPDFIARVRQMGFESMDKYLEFIGYDDKKVAEENKKKFVDVKSHEVLKRSKEIDTPGGGVEQGSGKVLRKGAIGDVSFPAE